MSTPTNDEVADRLAELASLTILDERDSNAFRVRAYLNAERSVRRLDGRVAEMSVAQLAAMKGIGRSIASRIREYVDRGSIAKLDELRRRHPGSKRQLLDVPGIGPRTVQRLEDELGIRDIESLAEAVENGRVSALPGLGEKSVGKLRRAIDDLGLASKQRRVPIAVAFPVAERLVTTLRDLESVLEAQYAGSVRRFTEDVGDVDILVASHDASPASEVLSTHPDVAEVIGSGRTKTSVRTHQGLQVDLRVVPPESYGAALVYFTGSKAHNIRLRQRALQRGWTMNEYGFAPRDGDGTSAPTAASEEEVYRALGLDWITPELREDAGEIEAAEDGRLPERLQLADLRGDLHDHTDLSGDGVDPLPDLVEAAVGRGLAYLAITDHAEGLRMNGVSRQAMLRQRRQIRDLEQARGDIALLHGAELNIAADGSLDYDEEFLAGFDWLVASVHSHFSADVREQTRRIVAALRHPSVTAIGHLTGRKISRRAGIQLDLDEVFDVAASTGTAIEVNASLDRLDASVEVIRQAAARGVTFVVSTDSHAVEELERARYGVCHARRAGLEAAQIANCWELDRFLSWRDDVRRR